MEINQSKSPLVDSFIRIARDNDLKTNRLQIWVTILIKFSAIKIQSFDRKNDLKNFQTFDKNGKEVGVLNFDIHVVPDGEESKPLKKPIVLSEFYELTNGEEGNADFLFDDDKNFIFLTNIITTQLTATRPEGTKRTVITYEDTDVIDETR